jgi:hypothetical protein
MERQYACVSTVDPQSCLADQGSAGQHGHLQILCRRDPLGKVVAPSSKSVNPTLNRKCVDPEASYFKRSSPQVIVLLGERITFPGDVIVVLIQDLTRDGVMAIRKHHSGHSHDITHDPLHCIFAIVDLGSHIANDDPSNTLSFIE